LTRRCLADTATILVLLGLALLQFGWIAWPRLGTLTALANAAFVLALCVAWLIRRLAVSHAPPPRGPAWLVLGSKILRLPGDHFQYVG
jgi:hypothetical protein